MREILFKAKRLDNGEWVEGSLLLFKDGDSFVCCEDYIPEVMNKYEVAPQTVCQYTGLKDKNGKKIFENDIVRLQFRDRDIFLKVGFGECEVPSEDPFCFCDIIGFYLYKENEEDTYSLLYCVKNYKAKVVGNIFDQKEKEEND